MGTQTVRVGLAVVCSRSRKIRNPKHRVKGCLEHITGMGLLVGYGPQQHLPSQHLQGVHPCDVFGSLPCLVKYDFICSGSSIRVFGPEAEGSLLP